MFKAEVSFRNRFAISWAPILMSTIHDRWGQGSKSDMELTRLNTTSSNGCCNSWIKVYNCGQKSMTWCVIYPFHPKLVPRTYDYFLLHQLIEFPYEAAGLILELQYPFLQPTCVITVPTLPTQLYSYRWLMNLLHVKSHSLKSPLIVETLHCLCLNLPKSPHECLSVSTEIGSPDTFP